MLTCMRALNCRADGCLNQVASSTCHAAKISCKGSSESVFCSQMGLRGLHVACCGMNSDSALLQYVI